MPKISYIKRTKCAVSGDSEFELLSSGDYPLFCGCTDAPECEDIIARMDFAISKPSGVVQLKNLIPLETLYAHGHDAGAVGALWERHHGAFADFVMGFSPQKVLEIGGGHGKLAQKCLEKDANLSYTIIEPNSSKKHENVAYIDGFFGRDEIAGKFDTIVHSHTFEHIYEPNEFLAQIHKVLENSASQSLNLAPSPKNSARERERERERVSAASPLSKPRLIFSLPNMEFWLSHHFTNCLNYEHTILLIEPIIEFLLKKQGFKLIKKQKFENHSLFFACELDTPQSVNLPPLYAHNKALYMNFRAFYEEQIALLNDKITHKTKAIYLFGAHLFSQFLLFNGLNADKIAAILDNNPQKQGKRLYGTRFFVQNPQILSSQNALVILNAGAYNDEIRAGLLQINAKPRCCACEFAWNLG